MPRSKREDVEKEVGLSPTATKGRPSSGRRSKPAAGPADAKSPPPGKPAGAKSPATKPAAAAKPAVKGAAAAKPAAKGAAAAKPAARGAKPAAKPAAAKGGKAGAAKETKEQEKARLAAEEKEEEETRERNRKHNEEINARLKEAEEKKKAEAAARAAELDVDELGHRNIHLTALQRAMEKVHEEGKTPLIVDPSGRADTFLGYQIVTQIDAKGMFLKVVVHKTETMDDTQEMLRQKVVNALKYGHLIHIVMQNGATQMYDYNHPDKFPVDLIFTPNACTEEATKPLIKNEDRDGNGMFIPKEITVCVTTQFEKEDFAEFLDGAIPLDKCGVIVVKPEEIK